MKLGFKCFIALVIAIMASFCVSASDTTTKFQTGSFTVTVDLGMPCNDINISKPDQVDTLLGVSYTSYMATACHVVIAFMRFDTPPNWSDNFEPSTRGDLIKLGVDKDTINVYDRTIDGKPGAVGSGYVPKSDGFLYAAGFHASPKSLCWIYVWDNETKMISVLKTIHVTENV